MSSEVADASISLFSGGGFGDIGIEYGAGIPVVLCCELLTERADVLKRLFPSAAVHCGDIWECKDDIIRDARNRVGNNKRPRLLLMSPPCQGMSTNGVGRIMAAVAQNMRPRLDPRNRLILPALEIVEALQPEWVIIENVPNMRNTVIMNEFDTLENVLDVVRRRLSAYDVQPKTIDAASYGVPQRRERLITVCRRIRPEFVAQTYHPVSSHGSIQQPYVTLRAATQHLPELNAISRCRDPADNLHRIPKWTHSQHFAMHHTPEGETAFHNDTCLVCGLRVEDDQLVNCPECSSQMPRPVVEKRCWKCRVCGSLASHTKTSCSKNHTKRGDEDEIRVQQVIRAFKTAYRRMHYDRPSSTLTTNSGVISSDVKGHPVQDRVLSTREVLIVSSVSDYPGFHAPWSRTLEVFETLSDRCIRHIAGESIPPLVTFKLVKHLLDVESLCQCPQGNRAPE